MNAEDIEALGRELSIRTYLATTSTESEPHVVPVHPGWEGTTIWVLTARSSIKARNVMANGRVAMHWETNEVGDGLLVWGNATVVVDGPTKERLWSGVFDYDLGEFAPGGPNDPDTVFLRITPTRAVHARAYGFAGVQRWSES